MTTAFESGYALVNGLNLYYEIHGKGYPLVLIHGGGSTIGTSFGRILPSLAKHHQVIAVELQGHGHTPAIERDLSFEQDADDVAALLEKLSINRANIFGFSNGGNTSIQLAVRHPQKVNRLVLASTFFKREGMMPGLWDFMPQATLENMPKQLQEAYLEVAPEPGNLIIMHNRDRDRMLGFKDWDPEMIRSIQAPTLVMSADRDVVQPEHAVELFRLLPAGQLAIFPGGHGEYLGEITFYKKDDPVPERVAAMITEFLNS